MTPNPHKPPREELEEYERTIKHAEQCEFPRNHSLYQFWLSRAAALRHDINAGEW